MTQRLAWTKVEPAAYDAMLELERYASSNLDATLYELIKMRASFLNGCAYCLDKHTHDAIAQGETVQRLVVVAAWQEARDLFTLREQAALALTDAVTRLGEHGVPDAVWAQGTEHFDDGELVHLIMAIATINAWNRIAISVQATVSPRT